MFECTLFRVLGSIEIKQKKVMNIKWYFGEFVENKEQG